MSDFWMTVQGDTSLKKIAASGGGEWAGPCPFCGGTDRFHIQPYHDRWLCRSCTEARWKGVWEYFNRRDGRQPENLTRRMPQEARRKVYSWLANPEPLIRQYEDAQGRVEKWQAYKPLSEATIIKNRLGVGVLPQFSSACHGERLIVPIFDGTLCVGIRARWMGCKCCDPVKAKWVTAGGTTLPNLPLYGQEDLKKNCVVWLVENCPDSKLITQDTDFVGNSIYSTTYWRLEWIETLRQSNPELIVVCLDNDLAGNGGAWQRDKFIVMWCEKEGFKYLGKDRQSREWYLDRKGEKREVPEPYGVKRVRELHEAGLRQTILYDWKDAKHKADIGTLLEKGIE